MSVVIFSALAWVALLLELIILFRPSRINLLFRVKNLRKSGSVGRNFYFFLQNTLYGVYDVIRLYVGMDLQVDSA